MKNRLSNKKLISLILTVTLGISLFSFSSSASANTTVPSPEECIPAVLMLKGSGEGIDDNGVPVTQQNYAPSYNEADVYISTNGHEGQILGRLLEAFVDSANPVETTSKVRFIGIEYPALPVFPQIDPFVPPEFQYLEHFLRYGESYRVGAQMTVDFIENERKNGCETQYMLLSYSQGVIAARLAMNLLNNENNIVVSSYSIGDPFQKANAATYPRQISDANTSNHTDGVARIGANYINNNLFLSSTVMKDYIEYFTSSDSFIYKDDISTGFVSRSLCHLNDITCGFSWALSQTSQHLNYFNPNDFDGLVDINLEIEEFEKQVIKLANTSSYGYNPRALTKTPSIIGGITTYKVVNARPSDLCNIDIGSDGSEEFQNISCDTFEVTHQSSIAKITVRVVDESNSETILTSDVEAISPDSINDLLLLKENTWHQIYPYGMPGKCVTVEEDNLLEELYDGRTPSIKDCYDIVANTDLEKVKLSEQLFKYNNYPNMAWPYQGMGNAISWGFDDEHVWTIDGDWSWYKTNIAIYPAYSSSTVQPFEIKMAKIVDGVPFYRIKQTHKNVCAFISLDNSIKTETCSDNTNQLFSFGAVSGDYGNLVNYEDNTPPSEITNFNISNLNSQGVQLNWDPTSDDRHPNVLYQIKFKIDYINGSVRNGQLPTVINETSSNIKFSSIWSSGSTVTLTLIAEDYDGNKTSEKIIIFLIP